MRKQIIFVLFIVLLLVSFYLKNYPVFAQTLEELDQKRQELQKQISEVQGQLDQVRGQKKTLQTQLSYIDTQNKLTQLKVEATNTQIARLEKEINDLSSRISRLSVVIDSMTEILLNRIVQTYKHSDISTINLLFSSHGFADLLERVKYLQVAQANDKKILYQLQATKATYNDQKVDKETRQKQQEKLKTDLEVYEKQLDEQKAAKEELLQITQNKEANYQSLIRQLEADRNSILQAISNIGSVVEEVYKGKIIAREGNTGCVYPPPPGGYHLHFEVYKDAKVERGKIVDINSGEPIQFKLSNHLENPQNYLDSGRLGKPTAGFPGNITAKFGYSQDYRLNGGYHTGIDMADPPGAPIYAAESGIAYAAGGPICDSTMDYPPGTTLPAKGIIIDHQNGLVTLYWHIL